MFPQISIRHNIGNIIEIPNVLNSKTFTYLSNNFAIGVTALTVDNAIDFTSGSIILLLGSVGAENAEFNVAASHTDQAFVTATTKMPHNRGDLVSQINYDQVEISKCATIDGTYSVLATFSLDVTQQKTVYFDAVGTTGEFYKLRWKNSVTGTFSEYSDPISVLTYPINSVGSIIFPVLKAVGVSENDTKITTQFCIEAVNDARKYVNMKLYGIRHAWRSEFEYPLKVLAGSNYVNLPDNIDFDESDRSLLAARFISGLGLSFPHLRYIDKRSWNSTVLNLSGGVTTVEAGIAATEITLKSIGDFSLATTGGTAHVATTDFDQTILEIEFTGVDLVTNQLTGVTGIDRVIPAGTQIWFFPTIAQPTCYTVYNDKIVFDQVIPDSMQGSNCYIDYYTKAGEVEDLYQELREPYREIYKWYLRYAIKYRKDNTIAQSDPDYKKFEELVQALFNNLYTGQVTTITS